jgi:hypothetical protein
MSRSKFENNVWITFYLNNKQCLGRTVIINNQEMVAVISEDGNSGHLPFIEIEKPAKLSINKKIPDKIFETSNKIAYQKENEMIKPVLINDEFIKQMCFIIGEA